MHNPLTARPDAQPARTAVLTDRSGAVLPARPRAAGGAPPPPVIRVYDEAAQMQARRHVAQRAAEPRAFASDPGRVHEAARAGLGAPAGPLPHGGVIQRAFGRHSLDGVRAHRGPLAAAGAGAIGAAAYTQGEHVVLGAGTDLHTTAHEAAHVVQQRAGVSLPGGVGRVGDAYERHADAVADRVVAGRSAEDLLHRTPGGGAGSPGGAVQRVLTEEARQQVGQMDRDTVLSRIRQPQPGEEPGEIATAWLVVKGNQNDMDASVALLRDAGLLDEEQDELEEEQEDELAGLPATELLKKAFLDAGVPRKHAKNLRLFNLLLDLGAKELKEMEPGIASLQLPGYYEDWLMYTSCHRTAAKLFSQMGVAGEPGDYTGLDKDETKDRKDGAWLADASGSLAAGIAGDLANDARAIYEVHAGGHGFVVLVRNGTTEILQSFANAVSLVERMERGPLELDGTQIQNVVTDLASDDERKRDASAQIIANCDAATFGLDPYPAFQFRWRRQALRSDQELLTYFTDDLKAAFAYVKKNYRNLLGL